MAWPTSKEKTPIRFETTFELASLSKPFTSLAVCILKDRGKLSLDDEVRKYVPELPEFDKKNPIRIVNLLQHTSGLPDYTEFDEPKGRHPNYVDNEDYAKLIADKPKLVALHFQPGAKYEYSNTNFMLLALIVERMTKKSLGTFMHDEVFVPLGMKHSWIYERPDPAPKHPTLGYVNAVGYRKDRQDGWTPNWGAPPFRTETLLATGDGCVWTSLEDMVQFNAGMHARKLLKPETWKRALAPSHTKNGKTNDYGFGWGLGLEAGGKIAWFGHNGSWRGFRTQYRHYPEGNRAIIVLSNGGGNVGNKIVNAYEELFEKPGGRKGK